MTTMRNICLVLLIGIAAAAEATEPVTHFWDVVVEGRTRNEESSYRLEIWLEESTGRLVSMTGAVLDVRKLRTRNAAYNYADCMVSVEMRVKPSWVRLDIGMPCSIASELVREQEFTAVCAMSGQWDPRENIPNFHECVLKIEAQ